MKNMSLVCSGKVCTSTENTLIDGEKIRFYEFPTDETLREAWVQLLNPEDAEKDTKDKVLCELHFDKDCFNNDKQLKPNSIPTYSSYTQSPVSPKFSSAYDEPVAKKPKLDKPTETIKRIANALQNVNENKLNMTEKGNAVDNKASSKKPYRLTVQIDKIFLKPGPKSKKQSEIKIKFISPSITSEISESLGRSIKLKNSSNLLAYNQCLICKKVFSIPTDLYVHLKEHFTCDICKQEFTSIKSHNKHYKIHKSDNVESPFKCHVCNLMFSSKKVLSEHTCSVQPVVVKKPESFHCKDCNIFFKSHVTYRRHLLVHKQEPTPTIENSKQNRAKAVLAAEKPAIELDCKICNVKSLSVLEAENHIKTHAAEKATVPNTS